MMTRRSIANSIIKNTKSETRSLVVNDKRFNDHTNLLRQDLRFYAFSDTLAQDLITCIKDEDRNDKTYGRAELFDKEIKKVEFILTVVEHSTPEELFEYIAGAAEISRDTYESNKNIAKKYKDYISKTLIMIIEKDTKLKKDSENIMNLQAELIKINTFIQACETFEKNVLYPTEHGVSVSTPLEQLTAEKDSMLPIHTQYYNKKHITGVFEKTSGLSTLEKKIMNKIISTSPILKLPKDEGEIITPIGPSGLNNNSEIK